MTTTTKLPNHNNLHLANQTHFWHSSDSEDSWLKNMKDIKNSQFLKKHGWDNTQAFTYCYNSHGFRCKEFNNEPCYIALGCSHTEGVGLPEDQSWPNLLSTKLTYPVLNLGVGGSSFDTVVRLLDYYIDKLNIKGVFILEPPANRFELFEQTIPKTYMAADPRHELIYKQWVTSEYNIENNVKKNRYASRWICHTNNIKLISFESQIIGEFEYEHNEQYFYQARDLKHYGEQTQQYIANRFYFTIKS